MTVHHVALETRPADADAVVAFFVLLGFEEVPPPVLDATTSPSRRTSATTPPAPAPSAMRTPISRVRSDTAYATPPNRPSGASSSAKPA